MLVSYSYLTVHTVPVQFRSCTVARSVSIEILPLYLVLFPGHIVLYQVPVRKVVYQYRYLVYQVLYLATAVLLQTVNSRAGILMAPGTASPRDEKPELCCCCRQHRTKARRRFYLPSLLFITVVCLAHYNKYDGTAPFPFSNLSTDRRLRTTVEGIIISTLWNGRQRRRCQLFR